MLEDSSAVPPQVQQSVVQKTVDESTGKTTSIKKSWPPLENGASAQAPNLLARNYLLVLDHSGSMGSSERSSNCDTNGRSKIDVAKAAITEFAKAIPNDANIGLEWFAPSEVVVPLSLNTPEQNQGFVQKLMTAESDSGTPIAEAMELAYNTLTAQAVLQLGYGEYYIVIVTDGAADSGSDPGRWVEFITKNTPIVIYTIGFCIGSQHSLNQPGITTYKNASNVGQLAAALQDVLAEAPDFTPLTFE